MEFAEQVRSLAQTFERIKDNVNTEEATKHSMVMPFLQVLGYNPFDPTEVIPEFTADIGIKKGEKVDYAVLIDGKPLILIEAKCEGSVLDPHAGQLLRYFGVTPSRFAVLTNGVQYQFFTDLEEKNRMDVKPFLSVEVAPGIRDSEIAELKRFHKSHFDPERIMSSAQELKYVGELKRYLRQLLAEPDEDFLRLAIKKIYGGMVTKAALDRFTPMVHNALKQVTNEMISDRLQGALEEAKQGEMFEPSISEKVDSGVETTRDELEGYYVIRSILRRHVPCNCIEYKDTKSYFSINYEGSVWKWICRLRFTANQKSIQLRARDGKLAWQQIQSLDDLFAMESQLIEALSCAMGSPVSSMQ